MRILVDGDACPQRDEIASVAKEYGFSMIVFMDYAHVVESEDYEIRTCEVGKDQVDFMIVSEVKSGDLVITQDYGLAALVLTKGALVLHVSGRIVSHDDIDGLLLRRYKGYQQRKKDKHIKGPRKRSQVERQFFINQLKNILEENK